MDHAETDGAKTEPSESQRPKAIRKQPSNRPRSEVEQVYSSTGTQWDVETSGCYYRHRIYHSQLGRFVSRDPVAYEGSKYNLYEYVSSYPIAATDPGGLRPWSDKRWMFSECTIVIFYGHDLNIEAFLKENRVHFQTGCYYSSAVTCHSAALRPWLPSLMPNAELSPLPLDWNKRKPGYEFGPDMWKKNLEAAEKDAQLLCDPPCCCEKVVISRKCIGSYSECTFRYPREMSKTIDCIQ